MLWTGSRVRVRVRHRVRAKRGWRGGPATMGVAILNPLSASESARPPEATCARVYGQRYSGRAPTVCKPCAARPTCADCTHVQRLSERRVVGSTTCYTTERDRCGQPADRRRSTRAAGRDTPAGVRRARGAKRPNPQNVGPRVGAALGEPVPTVNVTLLRTRNLRYHFRAITTASREELPIWTHTLTASLSVYG